MAGCAIKCASSQSHLFFERLPCRRKERNTELGKLPASCATSRSTPFRSKRLRRQSRASRKCSAALHVTTVGAVLVLHGRTQNGETKRRICRGVRRDAVETLCQRLERRFNLGVVRITHDAAGSGSLGCSPGRRSWRPSAERIIASSKRPCSGRSQTTAASAFRRRVRRRSSARRSRRRSSSRLISRRGSVPPPLTSPAGPVVFASLETLPCRCARAPLVPVLCNPRRGRRRRRVHRLPRRHRHRCFRRNRSGIDRRNAGKACTARVRAGGCTSRVSTLRIRSTETTARAGSAPPSASSMRSGALPADPDEFWIFPEDDAPRWFERCRNARSPSFHVTISRRSALQPEARTLQRLYAARATADRVSLRPRVSDGGDRAG